MELVEHRKVGAQQRSQVTAEQPLRHEVRKGVIHWQSKSRGHRDRELDQVARAVTQHVGPDGGKGVADDVHGEDRALAGAAAIRGEPARDQHGRGKDRGVVAIARRAYQTQHPIVDVPGWGTEPDDLASRCLREPLARRPQLLSKRAVVERAEGLRMGQRVACDLVTRRGRMPQHVPLRLGIAGDGEEHRRDTELGEQLQQTWDRGPVDQIARGDVLEPVSLEMAVDRIEVAGEDSVAHPVARWRSRPYTAARTASAMKSTWSVVYDSFQGRTTMRSRPCMVFG